MSESRMNRESIENAYSLVTWDIRVTVRPTHIADGSDPAENLYAFSYAVTIENLGTQPVQLLERHWVITSAGKHFAEVVGPGVVGQQPTIGAGESFEYSSSAVIEDPIGTMQGSYTFRAQDGKFLTVEIPKFDLAYPIVIH